MFIALTRWSMERMPLTRALGPLAVVLALMALPAVASAQTAPTLSNTSDGAVTAEPNVHYTQANTSGFTRRASRSPPAAAAICDGRQHGGHLLANGNGTGGPITLSTAGSNFDSFVAVYGPNQTPSVASVLECSDDNRGDDVELTFDSVAGATYYTQWGGCVGAGCGVSSGSAKFAILTNDNREFRRPGDHPHPDELERHDRRGRESLPAKRCSTVARSGSATSPLPRAP